MNKLRIMKFWCVSFAYILLQVLKGNEWNLIYVDFHLGDNEDGSPKRKQLIARRRVNSFDIFWQVR